MRLIIFAFIVISAWSLAANAKVTRSWALGLSPISALLGGLNAAAQFKINDYLALTLPVGVSYDWIKRGVASRGITREPFSAFGGIGAKFFLQQRGLKNGPYLESRLTLNYGQFGFRGYKLYDATWLALRPVFRAGYDWYFASNFFMSLGAGVGANFYIKKRNTKLPKARDFLYKKLSFPPRDRAISLAVDAEFMLGMSW